MQLLLFEDLIIPLFTSRYLYVKSKVEKTKNNKELINIKKRGMVGI